MLSMYPACFFRESNDSYSVIFPDLNWLATQGDTFEEAMEMAVSGSVKPGDTVARLVEHLLVGISNQTAVCDKHKAQASGI